MSTPAPTNKPANVLQKKKSTTIVKKHSTSKKTGSSLGKRRSGADAPKMTLHKILTTYEETTGRPDRDVESIICVVAQFNKSAAKDQVAVAVALRDDDLDQPKFWDQDNQQGFKTGFLADFNACPIYTSNAQNVLSFKAALARYTITIPAPAIALVIPAPTLEAVNNVKRTFRDAAAPLRIQVELGSTMIADTVASAMTDKTMSIFKLTATPGGDLVSYVITGFAVPMLYPFFQTFVDPGVAIPGSDDKLNFGHNKSLFPYAFFLEPEQETEMIVRRELQKIGVLGEDWDEKDMKELLGDDEADDEADDDEADDDDDDAAAAADDGPGFLPLSDAVAAAAADAA